LTEYVGQLFWFEFLMFSEYVGLLVGADFQGVAVFKGYQFDILLEFSD